MAWLYSIYVYFLYFFFCLNLHICLVLWLSLCWKCPDYVTDMQKLLITALVLSILFFFSNRKAYHLYSPYFSFKGHMNYYLHFAIIPANDSNKNVMTVLNIIDTQYKCISLLACEWLFIETLIYRYRSNGWLNLFNGKNNWKQKESNCCSPFWMCF